MKLARMAKPLPGCATILSGGVGALTSGQWPGCGSAPSAAMSSGSSSSMAGVETISMQSHDASSGIVVGSKK